MSTIQYAVNSFAATTCVAIGSAASAGEIDISYDSPFLDRWMYAFNSEPGSRPAASTFGAFLEEPAFDNRDAQILLGFDTADDIEPNMGPDAYQITGATLTLTYENDENAVYDNTQDPWQVFINPDDPEHIEDEDPGQPLELFGAGYRYDFTALTFPEDGPYGFGDPTGLEVRSVFAQGYNDLGEPIDVSNSVRDEFNPNPFAIGMIDTLSPGELVPEGTVVEFAIDVNNANFQGYLQEALNIGRLNLVVTSLNFVEPMAGSFPSFYTKENALVQAGAVSAATLDLTVALGDGCTGDIDGSNTVDGADLGQLLGAFGSDDPDADLDNSGTVDGADLGLLLGAFGDCP